MLMEKVMGGEMLRVNSMVLRPERLEGLLKGQCGEYKHFISYCENSCGDHCRTIVRARHCAEHELIPNRSRCSIPVIRLRGIRLIRIMSARFRRSAFTPSWDRSGRELDK